MLNIYNKTDRELLNFKKKSIENLFLVWVARVWIKMIYIFPEKQDLKGLLKVKGD